MIWVDREVKNLKERKLPKEHVDDMKTPSGRIHVGALRGVVIHDLAYKVLVENGINSAFTYVFNNMDQMDAIPSYLDYDKWEKYAGMPLNKIPSPEEGAKNFAEYYAKEFIEVFNSINCHPTIVWSSELYESGKMNDAITKGLDRVETIRKIYAEVTKAPKADDWYPFQVICEKCGKIGTTTVFAWDGKEVSYRCREEMVAWAKGCGHEGKVSPYNGNGKFHWRIDWPAHWSVIGVTVEGSGKDHMSSGGSYDMASRISKEVFDYDPAYALPYEWFTIGGRKMSSSKGIGASAKEVCSILPPEVFRFLIVRTPIGTALDFNPYGDTILNLFDDFDRCMNAYFDKIENKIPEGKPGEVLSDFARIMELSEVRKLPATRILLPRFRTIVNILKVNGNIEKTFEIQKGSTLNAEEKALLDERIKYAKTYLEKYAQDEEPSTFLETVPENLVLSVTQKEFISLLKEQLSKKKPKDRETLQDIIFNTLKKNGYQAKEVFAGFYEILIGKEFGPKAADLILQIGLEKVLSRFEEVTTESAKTNSTAMLPTFTNPAIFSIDPQVSKKFPSISIGIAVIKGVKIKKNNKILSKQIEEFVNAQKLTNEVISSYPEILSYRKLYKEMGVDWHSRRPSPEALLRRVAQGKGLYQINDCVDAYNLVVMKNRVSVGAFDLDKIQLPTVLRFPEKGEEILLLGDSEPTEYKEKELAYFDKEGGYNIDFNYRDAQRTAVSESTKNLYINVDGVYDISRGLVEKTLQETVDAIVEYCGGTVEELGVIEASL